MNRRELIKSAIIGTAAISVPVMAVAKEAPGKWIGLRGVTDQLIRIGDVVQIRVTPTFAMKPIGGNMMQLVSPYKNFFVTGIDYDRKMIKVIEHD